MGGRRPLDLEFLESKPKIKTRRVKALVAFGDMADFGVWTRRGSNSPEEFRSFMVRLYQEFIRFRNGNGYFVKLMGDGSYIPHIRDPQFVNFQSRKMADSEPV